VTYNSATNVRNLVGDTNVPNTVSDAMIFEFIVNNDGLIDALTQVSAGFWGTVTYSTSVDDAGVDRGIRAASAFLSASTLLRRMISEDVEGTAFTTGPISEDRKNKIRDMLAMAMNYEKQAMAIIEKNRGGVNGLFSLKRTL